jgi:plastocyanin
MGRGALITLVLFGALVVPANAATVDVTVANNAFAPADITVTQGDVVTWTFAGPDTNHSVTSTNPEQQGSFDSDQNAISPNHQVGDKFSVDMTFSGSFDYQCKVHPTTMAGKVTVVPKTNDPNGPPGDVAPPKFGPPTVAVTKRQARFTLNEDAQVSGKLVGPTRKTLKLAGKTGPNVHKLPKKLKPGRYGLSLRATDAAGNKSIVAKVRFRVPKPKPKR